MITLLSFYCLIAELIVPLSFLVLVICVSFFFPDQSCQGYINFINLKETTFYFLCCSSYLFNCFLFFLVSVLTFSLLITLGLLCSFFSRLFKQKFRSRILKWHFFFSNKVLKIRQFLLSLLCCIPHVLVMLCFHYYLA